MGNNLFGQRMSHTGIELNLSGKLISVDLLCKVLQFLKHTSLF